MIKGDVKSLDKFAASMLGVTENDGGPRVSVSETHAKQFRSTP